MRDDRLLLKDILMALDRIDSFTKGMNFESFIADEKTMNAVTYNFLVIGEAVKLLPDTLTGAYGCGGRLQNQGWPAAQQIPEKTGVHMMAGNRPPSNGTSPSS